MLEIGPHVAHAAFEFAIGCCHLLFPSRIYGRTARGGANARRLGRYRAPPEQLLLGRFTGLLMWCVAFIGYYARGDVKSVAGRAVMVGCTLTAARAPSTP